jgi:acyl dehydratase
MAPATTRKNDLDVGDDLLRLQITLSSEQVRGYAVAARMPGGRFESDAAAQREGLPGQIVPGNLSIALFCRLIAESLPGARLQRLNATFRGIVRPGEPLSLHGVVTERREEASGVSLECDLVLESAEGERRVTGTATVLL